jgi:hypothetical protein
MARCVGSYRQPATASRSPAPPPRGGPTVTHGWPRFASRAQLQILEGWDYRALGSSVSPLWTKKASVSSGRYWMRLRRLFTTAAKWSPPAEGLPRLRLRCDQRRGGGGTSRTREVVWAQHAEARGVPFPLVRLAGRDLRVLVIDTDASIVVCHSEKEAAAATFRGINDPITGCSWCRWTRRCGCPTSVDRWAG